MIYRSILSYSSSTFFWSFKLHLSGEAKSGFVIFVPSFDFLVAKISSVFELLLIATVVSWLYHSWCCFAFPIFWFCLDHSRKRSLSFSPLLCTTLVFIGLWLQCLQDKQRRKEQKKSFTFPLYSCFMNTCSYILMFIWFDLSVCRTRRVERSRRRTEGTRSSADSLPPTVRTNSKVSCRTIPISTTDQLAW